MRAALLLALLGTLLALGVRGQGPASFVDRITFPTEFGQPSCMQYDGTADTVYIVGSSSFYAPANNPTDFENYGIQILVANVDPVSGEVQTRLSGRIADGVAGACLLARSGFILYVGVDGGALIAVDLRSFQVAQYVQLAPPLPGAFIAGLAWFDDGLNDRLYALNSNPPRLYLLDSLPILTVLADTSETVLPLPVYETRMLLPIVHDHNRQIVIFPIFGADVVTTNSTALLVYEETLDNATVTSPTPVPLSAANYLNLGTQDFRPTAFYNRTAQYSYWGIVGSIYAVDHQSLDVFNTLEMPFISELAPVPNSDHEAWAISSGDFDTNITLVGLPNRGEDFNVSEVISFADQVSQCGGWAWSGLFLTSSRGAERFAFLVWIPTQLGSSSFFCVVNNTVTPNTTDIVPVSAGVISNTPFAFMYSFLWDQLSTEIYTCGYGALLEWTFDSGSLSNTRTLIETGQNVLFTGFCREMIRLNNDIIFHDSNNVFVLRISDWMVFTHGTMNFVNPSSIITWITYDPAKKYVYVTSSESRMFIVDLSSPYTNNPALLNSSNMLNLPPGFNWAQVVLLDQFNQALYLGNCPAIGQTAMVVEVNTATSPASITSYKTFATATGVPECFSTGSWLDENTHRAFFFNQESTGPVAPRYQNPGLNLIGNDTQSAVADGAAVNPAGRQTWILGRDGAMADVSLLRRCWDNDTLGYAVVTTGSDQPQYIRNYLSVDGWYDSNNNQGLYMIWDPHTVPTFLIYNAQLTCPLINIATPTPGTLPPSPGFTFPPPPLNTSSPSTTPTPTIVNDGKNGLSPGAIFGIVIFVIIFCAAVVLVIYYLVTRRNKQPRGAGPSAIEASVGTGGAGAGAGAMSGAGSRDREGHQRFHDEDSSKNDRF